MGNQTLSDKVGKRTICWPQNPKNHVWVCLRIESEQLRAEANDNACTFQRTFYHHAQ
jgi:hypothetical protein